nr:hypothetical protein GCM10020092_092840 [Actinoplanes digitatis]
MINSLIATVPIAAAGMVTPPARAVPSHAAGDRQAIASSSRTTGSRLRQCGARLAADGRGGGESEPGASVFCAACVNAQQSPVR